ncbi:fungal-specific transcription factor domain-containing protein [Phaeosphaeriaceae sp. PMI808]|nr:fungal-specific transcription factor domain-containing protein [Phaeosphaeriaceae sp. PMI808]
MSEAPVTSNKRRTENDSESTATATANEEGNTRKRRAFLRTMGQQLREFGVDDTSPQSHRARFEFDTSLGSQAGPASRATNMAASHALAHSVETPESDAAPGEEGQMPAGAAKSASKWLWKAEEVHQLPLAGNAPSLQFDDLLDWSQSYFDHWHPAFPYLHAPSIINYLQRLSEVGLELPTSSPSSSLHHIILRSIMSISIADRRQMVSSSKSIPSTLVFHSFNDAINSVHTVLTEESSILSLQALVSVQLFLITMHRYNAASRLEGLATRMVFQLALNRCPHKATSTPEKEPELRKRLFWSIYCIDRYICIRLGTPLGIRSDETNVCFPHDERHHIQENDSRLSLLEFLARHASIRGAIMENRIKSAMRDDHNSANEIMEVEADHTRWWNTVDEYLSVDEGTTSIIKAHQIALIVLRFESVLALHRSVLATSTKDAAYNAALQRCISASRSIINTLHKALKGFGAFDGSPGQRGYESTPLVWPSFTWAVWMSTFIVIFAATEGQVARDTALRLAERSIQILQHLALRGTNWPEACIVAAQNLVVRLREGSTRSSSSGPRPSSSFTGEIQNENAWQHQNDHTNSREIEQRRLGQVTPGGAFMMPPGAAQNVFNHPDLVKSINSYSVSGVVPHPNGCIAPNAGNAYGGGNFLGIAQQSSDNPLSNDQIMHLFDGDDMGLWLGENRGYGDNFSTQYGNFY